MKAGSKTEHILHLALSLAQHTKKQMQAINEALEYAKKKGVKVKITFIE